VYVRRLGLTNFRCYRRLDLTLPCGTIVVAGGNAQGKTSLLEAIYVLATTRSPIATTDRELVHWEANAEVVPFSRVWGEVHRAGGTLSIEVLNARQAPAPGEERFGKRLRVNNAPRRAFDVIGLLNVVLFTPRDLEIVDGTPARRRQYLDVLLCQIDPAYCAALARFNRVLTQRNHLLRRLRDRGGRRDELAFWDERLVHDGARLMGRRLAAVGSLDGLACRLHEALAEGAQLEVAYRCSLSDPVGEPEQLVSDGISEGRPGYAAAPDGRALADAFIQQLGERREEELARGMTLVGPHRDDLAFTVGGIDMRTYGSRGQQRTITLALKLAEAQLMWSETGERPVLLLDDVLSELDARRRGFLLDQIDAHQQTLITITEVERLPEAFRANALALEVEAAQVIAASRDGHAVTPPVG
jgi:DNA replication and repair protein RecF